jgi:hypothetical protein
LGASTLISYSASWKGPHTSLNLNKVVAMPCQGVEASCSVPDSCHTHTLKAEEELPHGAHRTFDSIAPGQGNTLVLLSLAGPCTFLPLFPVCLSSSMALWPTTSLYVPRWEFP